MRITMLMMMIKLPKKICGKHYSNDFDKDCIRDASHEYKKDYHGEYSEDYNQDSLRSYQYAPLTYDQ